MASNQNSSEESGRPGGEEGYVAVMGLSGAGRSTFINKCMQNDTAVVGHTLLSCTWTTTIYRHVVDGKTVYLVDTPAFDNDRQSDAQTLEEISFWLTEASKHDLRIAGLVYVHRITDNRISGKGQRSLSFFKKMCGSQSFQQCLLVTTHWDLVLHDQALRAQAMSRQSEILNEPELWGEVAHKGGQYGALLDDRSANIILGNLVQHQYWTVPLLQEQLAIPGCRLADTDAGKVVVDHSQGFFLDLQQQLRQLREETGNEQKSRRDQAFRELHSHVRDVEDKLAARKRDIENLHTIYQSFREATLDKLRIEQEQLLKGFQLQQQRDQYNFDQIQLLCNQISSQLEIQRKLQEESLVELRRARHVDREESYETPLPPQYTPYTSEQQLTGRSHPVYIPVLNQPSQHQQSHLSRRNRPRGGIAEIIGATAGVASLGLTAASLGCTLM